MPKLAEYYSEVSLRGVGGVMGGLSRIRAGFGGLARATTAPIRGIGAAFRGLTGPIGLVTAALGAAGVAGSAGIIKLASDMESLDTQFKVLLGSASAASQMMDQINKFAAKTPFEQMELAKAAKQLLAYGEAQGDVIPTLRKLGDVSALSGARLEDLVNIYGKVRGQGKLTAETLDQFQERGIPIVAELAKHFGIAESEIRGMVSEGKVGFGDVQQAIASLTSEGGRFAGGMEELSKTTGGLWSTVTGNLKTLLAEFGKSIIGAFNLKDVLAGLGDWLGNLAENFQTIAGPTIEWLGAGVSRVVGVIRAVWSALSAWFVGIWEQWGGVLTQYFSTAMALVGAFWDVAAMAFNAIYDLVSGVFASLSEIVGGWFGNTEGGLAGWIEQWLVGVQFVAENWQLYFLLMWERVKLFFSNTVARIQALGTNIVRVLQWIQGNWFDIFVTIARYTGTVFDNMMKNLRALWDAFWNFLKTGSWDVDWTPLTDGFESAIKEMPDLVAANISESSPELDRLERELAARRSEFDRRRAERGGGAPTTETGGVPAASPGAGGGGGGAGPSVPGASTRGGTSGGGIAFAGLAALANQMQQEAGKRLQEKMAEATQRTANGMDRLAAATDGGAVRVKITGGVQARYG